MNIASYWLHVLSDVMALLSPEVSGDSNAQKAQISQLTDNLCGLYSSFASA